MPGAERERREGRHEVKHGRGSAAAAATVLLLVVATGCGGTGTGEPGTPVLSAPSATPSATTDVDATASLFPNEAEPVAIEPGTYRIRSSAWAVRDFAVTFPEGWTVQYGHVYAANPDEDDEFGFYAVLVDDIFSDPCEGDAGGRTEIGPSVEDLTDALLQQPGPEANGPIDTTFGGYPATRVDLTIPGVLDLETCNLGGVGLQIWYSAPADKYLVLLADGAVSVYIIELAGQRQVFLTQHRSATSDDGLAELRSVLDSIHFEE
jgi:hypothetical protein